jgi:hypothetical protein
MANQPPNPASNLNINLPPPSRSSNSSAPFTPRSSSFADDSDAEFDPTPLQSPGGPDYDDLPPSYDEARHQAVSDARQGVAPLDPNQIEAHRLTLNEGPGEPEIWEYRVRGEELDTTAEHEQAPEYRNFTNGPDTTIPVHHVPNSESVAVSQVNPTISTSKATPDPAADLLSQALQFTHHEPDADVQYAPHLLRRIAIPQRSREPVQFSRAYAKALHAHSIRPAEFVEFLDGLNALCAAADISFEDLLVETPVTEDTSDIVHDYIRGANEAFFAPRRLKVSLQSLSGLVEALAIPAERGQRAGAIASALDHDSAVERRAQALHPWIEALEAEVPALSTRSLMLREMIERMRAQGGENNASADSREKARLESQHEDPPHSGLDITAGLDRTSYSQPQDHTRHSRGRDGHRGGPWSPFGAPGRGPFGAAGNGPFGRPGNGPFGPLGRGPFGGRGRGSFGPPGSRSHGPKSSQATNEWAAMGQDIGKWGEQFGKKMGAWGEQFGKQASVWGQDIGHQANSWSQDANQRASGSGSRTETAAMSPNPKDALPPSYNEGPDGQETGVLRGDNKRSHDPPMYEAKHHGKEPAKSIKDDDTSSLSSDSSDSDFDSDSEDEDFPDTQATFLKRVKSINKQAEASAQKGKKTPDDIAQERAFAIEKAQDEKTAMDLKIGEKMSKRAVLRALRQKRRDLFREHRHKKRELKAMHTGKGKGKAKKTSEWKQAKKDYKEKKKELRKEKAKARKEWKEARFTRTKSRGCDTNLDNNQQELMDAMVWVVIENLD